MTQDKPESTESNSHNKLPLSYCQIVNLLTTPILLLDDNGYVLSLNESASYLTGFTKNDLGINTLFTDLIYEKDDSVIKITKKLQASQQFDLKTKILTKLGTYIPVIISTAPFKDAESGKTIFLIQLSDIRPRLELKRKENILSAALNSSLDGMAILDRKLNITIANTSFADMLGISIKKIIGTNIFELSQRETPLMEKKNFLYTMKRTGSWRGIITTTSPQGDQRQIEIGIYTIKAEKDTGDTGFISVSRDVTASEEQNTRIRALSTQLKEYSKLILKHLATVNSEFTFKELSKGVANITGFKYVYILLFNNVKPFYSIYYPESQILSRSPDPVDIEMRPLSFISFIKTGEKLGSRIYIHRDAGTDNNAAGNLNRLSLLLNDEYNKQIGCICIFDVNIQINETLVALDVFAAQLSILLQVKKLQEILNISRKEMEDFIYSISHDLKTPVMSIVGFSEMLRQKTDNKLTEDENHCLKRIEANVTLINDMVVTLLELSRAGRFVTEEDKKISVEDVIGFAKQKIEEKYRTQLDIKFPASLPMINYDIKGLTAVFQHLISNSFKFRKKDQPLEIEIGAINRKEDYVFYIKDNGTGIPVKGKERVFEPFFRLSPKDIEGTGMGLAIVKKIITSRRGDIWFESKEGEGSTFYFSILRKDTK